MQSRDQVLGIQLNVRNIDRVDHTEGSAHYKNEVKQASTVRTQTKTTEQDHRTAVPHLRSRWLSPSLLIWSNTWWLGFDRPPVKYKHYYTSKRDVGVLNMRHWSSLKLNVQSDSEFLCIAWKTRHILHAYFAAVTPAKMSKMYNTKDLLEIEQSITVF